uniref:Uncharacterized protein n=1 Tax=Pseudonaja textilis TaxID=8673 RepID=A0A670Z3L9_PSETE
MCIPIDPSTSRRFTSPSTAFPCGKMGENSGALSAPVPRPRSRTEARLVVDVLRPSWPLFSPLWCREQAQGSHRGVAFPPEPHQAPLLSFAAPSKAAFGAHKQREASAGMETSVNCFWSHRDVSRKSNIS